MELSLQLSHLSDIQRWILGWGSQATVLAPKELAEGVRAEAQGIVDN